MLGDGGLCTPNKSLFCLASADILISQKNLNPHLALGVVLEQKFCKAVIRDNGLLLLFIDSQLFLYVHNQYSKQTFTRQIN